MAFRKIIIGLMLACAAVACQDDKISEDHFNNQNKEAFLKQNAYGVYSAGTALIQYTEGDFQYSFNTAKKSFRLQTDNQQTYASCVLMTNPAVGQNTLLALQQKGAGNAANGDYEVIALKTEASKIWLWNKEKSIGFIVRIE